MELDLDTLIRAAEFLGENLTLDDEKDLIALIKIDNEIHKLQGQIQRAIEHRRELINSRNLNKNPTFAPYFQLYNNVDNQ